MPKAITAEIARVTLDENKWKSSALSACSAVKSPVAFTGNNESRCYWETAFGALCSAITCLA